ncbi:SAM-dependent methyltransferase [Paenibacillus qinlingensis]|uniref:SAM-dependent MidA family methyltransferase n=1 Tax=Paenibacillus qinlingensis TaxID=1837343 RepID=A0ABU1NWI0_9BACL|nr:SAM-dependent methyltransferase [Paenibacillus qinlingensis]MDR6551357.1 SAM-dependent MidA family methyltransferase [Paenibacillus qinlingensis]
MNQLGHTGVITALKERINSTVNQRITFRDYMEICLYRDPGGYYRKEQIKIGKQGDFYTSSSIGTIMGEMVAAFLLKQLHGEASQSSCIEVVEWGGGNGRMALHVLNELRQSNPDIYNRVTYTLIESSAFHRQLQREMLIEHVERIRFMEEAAWLSEGPAEMVYVLANELLDAFPIHRIQYKDQAFLESYVHWQEEEPNFQEIWLPLESGRILDYLNTLEVQWQDGQISEMNLEAVDWYDRLAGRIVSGCVIAIDYGDVAEELYASHRHQGTLMCYRNHEAHGNPFINQGEQDITAHVNFSLCQAAAVSSGFEPYLLQTQRQFLVEQGILEQLQNHFDPNPFSEVSKRNRSIRQLLLSDGMSELFKVFIAIKKGESA